MEEETQQKENELHYINKKGKKITLNISWHGIHRFVTRWNLLKPSEPIDAMNYIPVLQEEILNARRAEKLTDEAMFRKEKYGHDTLFYCSKDLTFVIQNASIVTVECHSNRGLNKIL